MTELNFDEYFKMQMNTMKFNRCHPDTKLNIYWVLNNLIYTGPYTMYFFLLANCVKYYLEERDYFNAFRNGVPFTLYLCMLLYYYVLIVNRRTLANLIKNMKADYKRAHGMNIKYKKVVLDYANKGTKIMKFWHLMMVVVVGVFIVKSIILTTYHTRRNGNLTLIPFHEMHYPFNIENYREDNIFIFAVTFVGETYYTSFACLIYVCTVPLGQIFMLHACGQLEIIKLKFDKLFVNDNVDNNLNDIVRNLQYIYRFVDDINTCFTLLYEVTLKQSIIMLPVTNYALIQSIYHGKITIEYISIILSSLFTCSMPCYYGDLLIQKGEEMRMMAYSSGWERVHIKSARKTLLIILTYSLRPIAIKSIFCTICLDTLADVYRQAYTIFNLMNAVLN